MAYTVRVYENAHYMDEDEAYDLAPFVTYTEAEAACRRIVDAFLAANRRPGMSAAALFELYTRFGEDPIIRGAAPGEGRFSAWDYARARSAALCKGR
ncbi:MAG: hypothetical protein KIT16_17485 [Rhodospirillaceae bacterium]|nr:hypothetical protein [Rhodospirillaceae bacterium]